MVKKIEHFRILSDLTFSYTISVEKKKEQQSLSVQFLLKSERTFHNFRRWKSWDETRSDLGP